MIRALRGRDWRAARATMLTSAGLLDAPLSAGHDKDLITDELTSA